MDTNEFPILAKPPIQEIILGIGYKNYLSESTDWQAIASLFSKDFSINSPVFEMSFTNGVAEQKPQVIGTTLLNSLRTESLIIDKNRVTFIDRSSYQGFDPFYDKFIKIFRKINKFKAITNPVDIGLKIVNKFFVEIDEITLTPPKIYFLPQIGLKHQDKDFAGCVRTGGKYLLRNMTYHNLESVVSTEMQLLGNPPRFLTLFVTDTRITINKLDEKILEENIKKMREFKNKIFFANVSETIKDFNK